MKSHSLPGWLRALFLAAIPIVAVGMVMLGFWQLSRLQERRARNAEIAQRMAQPPIALEGGALPAEPEALEYRPVVVRGTYDFSQEVVWKNQAHDGSPGVHIITPLRLAGSESAVLVDRGWIPYTQSDLTVRAAYQTPTGPVEVSGLVRLPVARAAAFLPADPTISPDLPRLDAWFWLDIAQIRAQVPYPLLPVIVSQSPSPDAEQRLPIPENDVDLSDGPHLSYAIQWFAFAAIAILGPLLYWRQSRRVPVGGRRR